MSRAPGSSRSFPRTGILAQAMMPVDCLRLHLTCRCLASQEVQQLECRTGKDGRYWLNSCLIGRQEIESRHCCAGSHRLLRIQADEIRLAWPMEELRRVVLSDVECWNDIRGYGKLAICEARSIPVTSMPTKLVFVIISS
jgi:hypothetical protein